MQRSIQIALFSLCVARFPTLLAHEVHNDGMSVIDASMKMARTAQPNTPTPAAVVARNADENGTNNKDNDFSKLLGLLHNLYGDDLGDIVQDPQWLTRVCSQACARDDTACHEYCPRRRMEYVDLTEIAKCAAQCTPLRDPAGDPKDEAYMACLIPCLKESGRPAPVQIVPIPVENDIIPAGLDAGDIVPNNNNNSNDDDKDNAPAPPIPPAEEKSAAESSSAAPDAIPTPENSSLEGNLPPSPPSSDAGDFSLKMGLLDTNIFDDDFFPDEIVLGDVDTHASDMETTPNPDYNSNTLLTTTMEPDFSNPYLQVVKFTPQGTVYSINGTVIEVVDSDPEKDSGKIVPAGMNYTYTMYDEDGLPTSTAEVPLYSIVPSKSNVTFNPAAIGTHNTGGGGNGGERFSKSSATTTSGGSMTGTPTAAAASAKSTKIYEDGAQLVSARSSYLSLSIALAIGVGMLMA